MNTGVFTQNMQEPDYSWGIQLSGPMFLSFREQKL